MESSVFNITGPYFNEVSLVGLSHKTLPVSEREKLCNTELSDPGLLTEIKEECSLSEAVLLSTCNRVEVVTVGHSAEDKIVGYFLRRLGRSQNDGAIYTFKNRDAVRHLFRVASSIDSLVLGEVQILSQVKDAYQRSVELGLAGKFTHKLFQFAFNVAKKVRANTELGERGVSVSYVAVKLAEQIFGNLESCNLLVLGSGTMAELAALHVKNHGCKDITVANRTIERAIELAGRLEASAISLNDAIDQLNRVDIVIGSSTCTTPIITQSMLGRVVRTRPMFFIDLGVPRNFDHQIASIENVYLYTIDDLGKVIDKNFEIRRSAAKEAELIIDYAIVQFEKWLHKVSLEPLLIELRSKVDEICASEIRNIKGLHTTPSETLSHRISQKISHHIMEIFQGNLESEESDE